MRKYLDSNPDKHCALLILLIIGGFGLKMCIYIGAWSPVGVLLLSLIRMGALFEGIIVRSYDAFDDPEPTEENAPPDYSTSQQIEDGENCSDILDPSNESRETLMKKFREELPILNLLALIITML